MCKDLAENKTSLLLARVDEPTRRVTTELVRSWASGEMRFLHALVAASVAGILPTALR
jgi:hypothetical protein